MRPPSAPPPPSISSLAGFTYKENKTILSYDWKLLSNLIFSPTSNKKKAIQNHIANSYNSPNSNHSSSIPKYNLQLKKNRKRWFLTSIDSLRSYKKKTIEYFLGTTYNSIRRSIDRPNCDVPLPNHQRTRRRQLKSSNLAAGHCHCRYRSEWFVGTKRAVVDAGGSKKGNSSKKWRAI